VARGDRKCFARQELQYEAIRNDPGPTRVRAPTSPRPIHCSTHVHQRLYTNLSAHRLSILIINYCRPIIIYRKCIDLRRRITDIEDPNDGTRTRIHRLNRGIQKMRLERAFLLEALNKHMEYNVDDSDRSSSLPPTPTDKPLRSKRSHPNRKGTPPAEERVDMGMGGRMGVMGMHPMSSAQSTPDPGSRPQNSYFSTINAGPSRTSPHTGVNGAPPSLGQTTLPPLHLLPSLQQQQSGQRQYQFDPAYDEQRPTGAEEDDGRRRAYSGAQQPRPSAEAQNGDTDMPDAGTSFASANH
jgi:hypothetical protein